VWLTELHDREIYTFYRILLAASFRTRFYICFWTHNNGIQIATTTTTTITPTELNVYKILLLNLTPLVHFQQCISTDQFSWLCLFKIVWYLYLSMDTTLTAIHKFAKHSYELIYFEFINVPQHLKSIECLKQLVNPNIYNIHIHTNKYSHDAASNIQ